MITLTRMNSTFRGYMKRDEHAIALSEEGADQINQIIERSKATRRAPQAFSFSQYEDGEMSGLTWLSATALTLNFRLGDDRVAGIAQLAEAARQLQVGHLLITAAERSGASTIALVIPVTARLNSERYTRLISVIFDELRAVGCTLLLASGSASKTHQLHLYRDSEAVWMPGPALDGLAKIKATRLASQNLDHRRMSFVDAQVNKPEMTVVGDDLFEW